MDGLTITTVAKIINSIGLVFDVVGAFLVAYEVVKQFKGRRYEESMAGAGVDPPPKETREFTSWESTKFKKMRRGLLFLILGFVLQMISNWPFIFSWLYFVSYGN